MEIIWSRMRSARLAGALARSLSVVFALVLVAVAAQAEPMPDTEAARLDKCNSVALALIKPDKIDVALLRQISDHCQAQIRSADVLLDFDIRRSKYLQQQVEGTVLLWMVVALTISGVVMAALQLFVAYRLAVAGRGEVAASSELTLEQGKISLKSSVTGLLILVVSFAFFIVYVTWVFTIKETKIDVEAMPAPSALPITLGVGGLGPPPKN